MFVSRFDLTRSKQTKTECTDFQALSWSSCRVDLLVQLKFWLYQLSCYHGVVLLIKFSLASVPKLPYPAFRICCVRLPKITGKRLMFSLLLSSTWATECFVGITKSPSSYWRSPQASCYGLHPLGTNCAHCWMHFTMQWPSLPQHWCLFHTRSGDSCWNR